MKRHALVLAAVLAYCGGAAGADPPPAPAPWIVYPDNPPQPLPPPPIPPAPDAVISLDPSCLYVLDCKDKVFFTVMPAGVLTVDAVPGPFAAFGKFYGGDKVELRQFAGPQVLVVRATGQGQAMLHVIRQGATGPADVFTRTISSGTGPQPPPGPGPNPPGPDPDPFGDATPGLKVLFILETSDTAKLPAWQTAIATSPTIRNYLNAHCGPAPDGKTKAWRVWDKDVPTTNEAPLWQKAMAKPRTAVPWVMIGDGKHGYSGPLPAKVADMLALLQKYGGA